ncbi:MAG TPA: hypothetical protein VFV80_01475 [Geminicoccaceae bacterium]|nr:hypothetical protein [Geminicoccaceae bacterium]
MLRILIVATLLFLVSATAVEAGSPVAPGEGIRMPLLIAARASAQAVLQPAVRASMPTRGMLRSINGGRRSPQGGNAMFALFHGDGDRPGLALPVSDAVSLDLRYQYLRPEDIHRDIAETAALDEAYSSHNVVVRARWHF